ncbi:CRISPR-associated endonuclease Cas3'' [Xanthobacter sp. TB0139]|uniref:CRISPR-associated endonuclease Cas3'' n=1 Tax=Xanthobacter sp. TB0139 TaxID=3459178 RepID=UPI004039675A
MPQKHFFFAHSTERQDRSDWEPLPEHLACVATHASQLARSFGAEKAATLAGRMHDRGKYSLAFQRYIQGRGLGVDHSTTGAQQAYRLGETAGDRLMAQLVAYAIAGHHAGLPNFSGGNATLSSRLEESYPIEPLHDIWREEVQPDASGLLPPALRLKGGTMPISAQHIGALYLLSSCGCRFSGNRSLLCAASAPARRQGMAGPASASAPPHTGL